MADLPEELELQARLLGDRLVDQIAKAGSHVADPTLRAAFLQHVKGRVRRYLTEGAAAPPDGRTGAWATRIRLYMPPDADEPMADTEPDADPDAGGTWIINGLPGVARALAQTVTAYHAPLKEEGLDSETLKRGIRGLRPTLSRHGGSAVWRVPYGVQGVEWLARVDVTRVG